MVFLDLDSWIPRDSYMKPESRGTPKEEVEPEVVWTTQSAAQLASLPATVVRLILEHAAFMDREALVSWVLISKAVKNWLDPILYHTVILSKVEYSQSFVYALVSRADPGFFSRSVKVFACVHYALPSSQSITQILKQCRGITTLAYYLDDPNWDRSDIRRLVASLPKLRNFSSILMSYRTYPEPRALNDGLSGLMLDMNVLERAYYSPLFPLLPSLTHVLINLTHFDRMVSNVRLVRSLLDFVEATPPTVEVLILHIPHTFVESYAEALESAIHPISEERFVCMSLHPRFPAYMGGMGSESAALVRARGSSMSESNKPQLDGGTALVPGDGKGRGLLCVRGLPVSEEGWQYLKGRYEHPWSIAEKVIRDRRRGVC
ncbi:hypothetical protein CYLTODRAFT_457197 [Cylindrobasidium torrendii FP15055 ss-10]|uniref:F-box domain-containing protein n=1 Tax=Cylindrobasidium torrendii FP15055 ss-10 TaxID=1314674 RepID=A0A0D7B2P7_9AGAR|nr:hypothetical protein CYLTODRAFT_457197 [Cylindrobasidium torrendii FP15055 ss-10]